MLVCLKETTVERNPSEPMETDVKDASLSEALNDAGQNEVVVVTSLPDPANVGTKEMSVDESHRSEAVTPSEAPTPTVGCFNSIIDMIGDLIFLRLKMHRLPQCALLSFSDEVYPVGGCT